MKHNLKKPSIASYDEKNFEGEPSKCTHKTAYSMLIGAWAILEHTTSTALAEMMGIEDPHVAEVTIGTMDFRNKLRKLQSLAKIKKIDPKDKSKLDAIIIDLETPRDMRNKICHLPIAGYDLNNPDIFYLIPLRSHNSGKRADAYKMSYKDLDTCKRFAIHATRILMEIFPTAQFSEYS